MTTTIEVNKKNVKQLLESGTKKKFVIPEYQRPYSWTEDQIETLFSDLVEYTENDNESTYFLGTIVSYENEKKEQEIIDGQQRITSLFLFLRAIYSKLEGDLTSPESKHLAGQIEPALWIQDDLTGAVKKDEILISSRVMSDEANEEFADILITGKADKNSKSNYAQNYLTFQKLLDNYSQSKPMRFYQFINNLLKKAILLPIDADTQNTALTIFSTLNDRGLALSDADIFKAKIYNHLPESDKNYFIEKWQHLEEEAMDVSESIQKLFYYYMFYLRAIENDRKSTTPGIRKYYSKNNFKQLYQPAVMNDLDQLISLWAAVNNHVEISDKEWSKNNDIRILLDVLSSYPNEFWKYPVVIFYLKYQNETYFENKFLAFLKKLAATLSAKYIITPTINAVKVGILNLNANIIDSPDPQFNFSAINLEDLREYVKTPHKNIVRMILKMIAYQHQDNLLPDKWEIEHIMPQKWQTNYFPNDTDVNIQSLVEHIGNKIPFEKKLNIVASNGYFKKKQDSYNQSNIQIVKKLSQTKNSWGLDNIHERDVRVTDELVDILNNWGLNSN
ncbi:DUF262 domain-containing protein [Fructobacillus parabroussonetiae]|uniref:DUF262 domain-containing protein n=1 Tax=Fructobacillus parabroussonetiae TaxID=2713174 RepID=A0ABS5QXU0_9LACO|nr:DUF262 domain-containing protein [Fructobacillus parabroussonetiae]